MDIILEEYDPTKRGLIYQKPGNKCRARTHEEVAGDTPEEGYKSGLAKQCDLHRRRSYFDD
jgi:hypothetical protein